MMWAHHGWFSNSVDPNSVDPKQRGPRTVLTPNVVDPKQYARVDQTLLKLRCANYVGQDAVRKLCGAMHAWRSLCGAPC
eukprot:5297272-Pyramimonas_sp.AAC.1